MRTPRMSSLSRPTASTSSLSNSTIGYPPALICKGARSRNAPSDKTIAHGCIAKWRGRPSSRSAKEIVIAVNGLLRLIPRNSGRLANACEILRARICGKDFAIRSISTKGSPSAAPVSLIACRARYVSTIATVAQREVLPGTLQLESP